MTLTVTPNKESKNGNDVTDIFSFGFKINKSSHLEVTHVDALGVETLLVEGTGALNYSVNVVTYPNTGNIKYPYNDPTKLPTGEKLVLRRLVTVEQAGGLTNQGPYNASSVEAMLDYTAMIAQQQQEEIDRSLKVPVSDTSGANFTVPAPLADTVIAAWDATGTSMINGPTISSIAAAEGNAVQTAADRIQTGLDRVATGVDVVQTTADKANTAADVITVQNLVDSILWDVVMITFADSPVAAVAGKMYAVDTSGGNVVVNFPPVAEPASIALKKTTGDTNTVTAVPNGSDTIPNDAVLSSIGSVTYHGDIDTTPDQWLSLPSGGGLSTPVVDNYVAGTDFIVGATTVLTLSQQALAKGLAITFDGIKQHLTEWNLTGGTTVTFNEVIPSWVTVIEAQYFIPSAMGVPAAGSVGTNELATGAVTAPALSGPMYQGTTQDNDAALDMTLGNDFEITPTGDITITFAALTAGQHGVIDLFNTGGHTISIDALYYTDRDNLADLSAAGTYAMAYKVSRDGSKCLITYSGGLTVV